MTALVAGKPFPGWLLCGCVTSTTATVVELEGECEDGTVTPLHPVPAVPSVFSPASELSEAAKEICSALLELRADKAWKRFKSLQAKYGTENLAARLERLAPLGIPLRWMEAWGPVFEDIFETITASTTPPTDTPRPGEPPDGPGWTAFPFDPTEDFGISGSIYTRYLPGIHSVEVRSDLTLPGDYEDHFVGLAEVDLSAKLASNIFQDGNAWRSDRIPGNVLYWLIAKPPVFSSRPFWRDIVMHRQLVLTGDGVVAIEYSPTAFRVPALNPPSVSKDRSQQYFKGGAWSDGLPGVALPKCGVSGRDSGLGGSYITPARLPGGGRAVRFRNCQVVEIHFPRWFPMPLKWYGVAAGVVQRNCLRELSRAFTSPGSTAKEEYATRMSLRPSWYRDEWLRA